MSRRMGVLALTIAVAAALSALTAATAGARQTAAYKVAWIYVGPHNDHGWSQAHDAGRLYVQKTLGSKVQTTFKELVTEGPQAGQVIDSLVRDGNKMIFATSFGYQDAMAAAAKKYPDVKFEQATGFKTSKNLAEYYGAGEDAIYLSGMAAGSSGTRTRSRSASRPRTPARPSRSCGRIRGSLPTRRRRPRRACTSRAAPT
jgi:basic membrane protein A